MDLYFDNAASCRPFEWAADLFLKTSLEHYANQEASGRLGIRAKKLVDEASARLASALAPGASVCWCGTGTDALRMAIQAHCSSHPGTEIITTAAEHPALGQAILKFAAMHGITVRLAKLSHCGELKEESLRALLSPKTSMVAIHHVHSETGFIQNLENIRSILDSLPHKIVFLADTMQSAGKLRIPWDEAKLDFCCVSGCKIGSPGGAALLFRDSPDRIVSQRLLSIRRHDHAVGRCLPAAAYVLSLAAERITGDLSARAERIRNIRQDLLDFILKNSPCKVIETVSSEQASPYILHLIFPELQGAVLVRILESRGVSAAAGSACMAETAVPSAVLTAMGYPKNTAFGAFRVSFWDDTSDEDVKVFKNILLGALKNY